MRIPTIGGGKSFFELLTYGRGIEYIIQGGRLKFKVFLGGIESKTTRESHYSLFVVDVVIGLVV